jgi:hypothetical protein
MLASGIILQRKAQMRHCLTAYPANKKLCFKGQVRIEIKTSKSRLCLLT